MPSLNQNQVDREDSAFLFICIFLVWFIFPRKSPSYILVTRPLMLNGISFSVRHGRTPLVLPPHLWVMAQVLHWEPHGNPPATLRNFPSTGGSKIWLLIKITGEALKKYSFLGPNYQEKLISVFLGNKAHSFVFLKSLQMTLMCSSSWEPL